MNQSAIVLVLAALAAPPSLAAQEAPGITLEEALRLFAVNNLDLRMARARAVEAAGLARQAAAFPNPTVAVTHEPLSVARRSYQESYLNVSQRVEVPGKRGARADAADHARTAAIAQLQADSTRLAFEVKRAFVEAALAAERAGVTERVTEVFRVASTSASTRHREGDVSLYDLRRIGLERARYENLEADAALSTGVAERALALLVAPEQDAPRLVPEALPARFPLTVEPRVLAGATAERRSELVAARAELEAARAEARFARADRLPDLTAVGGYKRQSDGLHGAFLGLSISLPLFDRNGGAVAAADARVRAAEERLALTRRQLDNDLLRTADAYRSLLLRANLLLADVDEEASDVLAIARVAYDAGEMELVELLDAAEALWDARLAEARLRAELRIAYYDLERALGGFDAVAPARATEEGP